LKGAGLALVLSGFPRRSETFALQEILALEARGALAAVFATKPGDDDEPQPGYERIGDRVQRLPPGTPDHQARQLAARLTRRPIAGIHGYFAHAPAEVAELAAAQLGIPYGFSAHARDVRKVPRDALARRARSARCVLACNADVENDLRSAGARVQLVPHGVDLERFHPGAEPRGEPLRLLAVGRLVPKKGLDVLVRALELASFPWALRIVGEGPERGRLDRMIADAALRGHVQLCGVRTHRELPAEYAAAHVVVVPSVVDATGDRDGLPNVVLEAMASERAVVASEVGAIGMVVRHGHTGLLVPPGDAGALAAALASLAARPLLRERLARAGLERVRHEFELGRCADRLLEHLEAAYA
jgi:glycosyltransferase involved in cell wall biosynthesis